MSADLRREVLGFAKGIGLSLDAHRSPTGGKGKADRSNGFDDRDRPAALNGENGHPAKGSRAKKGKKDRGAGKGGKRKFSQGEVKREKDVKQPRDDAGQAENGHKKRKGTREAKMEPKPKHMKFEEGGVESAIKSRPWNEGAGPIPATLRDASAVADDLFASTWFAAYDDLPKIKPKARARATTHEEAKLEAEGQIERLGASLETRMKRQGGQDTRWLLTARERGTVRDKIAAAALLVQQNAAANLSSLEMLLSWVTRNKGSKDGVRHATEALAELFRVHLLPDRKLTFFDDRDMRMLASANGEVRKKLQLLWYVEDRVKNAYHRFVGGLEALSKDNLEHLKQKAIKSAYSLLDAKPEQESWLLTLLVNKLGDPSRKTASNVVFLLHQLLDAHPGMKVVVVREVEKLLFRPGLGHRPQYTCLIFLNQIVLSRSEEEKKSGLAEKLINLYFSLFQVIVQQGDIQGEGADGNGQGKHVKFGASRAKKKARHRDRGKPVAKADSTPAKAPDAEGKILSALLTGVNRAFPFVATESADDLISRHSPKLFQLVHGKNFGTAVQALMLLYQVLSAHLTLSDRYYRALYGALLHSELCTSSKTPMFLSVLFKSLKADVKKVRVAAILNRLLQVSAEARPNFGCGTLLLISEAIKHHPSLWSFVNESAGSGEERFHDVEEEEGEEGEEKNDAKIDPKADGEDDTSGSEGEGQKEDDAAGKQIEGIVARSYDMFKREPEFCGMDDSCFWELALLSSHYHPSVAIMSRTVLAGTSVTYEGDPLRDLSMSNFLGKFVSKKPKSGSANKEVKRVFGASAREGSVGERVNVGSDAFNELDESVIDPTEVFFHKFWSKRARHSVKAQKSNEDGDPDDLGEVDGEYDKLAAAMFADAGENSEDSGSISASESGSDNDEADGEEAVPGGSEDDSDSETSGLVSEEDGAMSGSDNDDIFAPAGDYMSRIEEDLEDRSRE